jgi:hypothetical protein
MIDDVNADCIVLVQCVGDLELGANSVNAGYQDRLLVSLEFK